MSKSLQEVLKPLTLDSLNVDYNSIDISTEYLRISDSIQIEDYLNYRDSHNKFVEKLIEERRNAPVLFHIVLSVRVDKKSRLVPFSSIYYNDIKEGDDKKFNDKDIKKELFQIGQSEITYTFTDFISPFFREFGNEYLNGSETSFQSSNGQEFPRISFMVDYPKRSIPYLRFLPKFGQTNWLKDSVDDKTIEKDKNEYDNKALDRLKNNLFRVSNTSVGKKEASFVDAFSGYYYSKYGINQLWYTFYNMDSDFDSSECLTRLMVICTNKKEVENFIFSQLNKIREIASFIRSRYTYDLLRKTRIEALKSAIAAIMSRNMSHNLGSHFISNTKNYFSALIECNPDNQKNYRGIKHALQYIQERMDFIATITSTETYPFGAVNAKAQIFDELTPDDFGKRHGQESYNFLMDNLVLSEKISKQSREVNDSLNKLKLQIGHWDGNGDPVFWDPTASIDEENKKRDEILGINFAIPGGILGRHAVFSIIENIIRNAAKHGQDKIHEKVFIVKMLYYTSENRLIVFDNKNDVGIKGTVEEMKEKLKKIRFLTPEGALDQESKGLKEMLICAIWLHNENVSQVMTDNDSQNEEDRLKNFNKYLKVVAVDENGVEIKELKNDTTGFLGYSIKLDQYERVHYLKEEELTPERLRNIKADVVCYEKDCEIGGKKLSDIFPRFIVIPSENDVKSIGDIEVLRQVVENNCGNEAIQRKMVVDYTTDYRNNSNVVSYKKWNQNHDAFLFKGHAGKSKWEKFETLFLTKGFKDKYVDAISGGDFTYTLVQPTFVNDEYNLLKIKESVATRFVIIDERIFEHYKSKVEMTSKQGEAILEESKSKSKVGEFVFKIKQVLGNGIYSSHEKELDEYVKNTNALSVFLGKDIEQHYLERRGLYVFNLESENEGFKMVDLSSNEKKFLWKKVEEKKDKWKFDCNDNRFDTKTTTFLSIHLGLIDKIKDQLLKNGENNGDTIDKEIVATLKLYFGANFVTIHSGRGGFDIRESLRQYAFQSFSAIENPLYNSKFLLAQQFYTLKYYGTE